MPLFGAHMSVAGGLELAFDRLEAVDGEALQIFVKNQRQWKAKPLSEEVVSAFKERARANGVPVAAHGAYLVNLAATNPDVEKKSVDGFVDELNRCETLGVPWLVIHPGSHTGAGVIAGIERVVRNLDLGLELSATSEVKVLLENTAGQGTNLGSDFAQMRDIIGGSRYSQRLGVCFDTCHGFAAGYELRTVEGYERTLETFDETIGLGRLEFFHINDSMTGFGANRDRHTHIGEGEIGLEGFANLVNDPRFASHPMVLETPKDENDAARLDSKNIKTLRSLVRC